LKGRHVGAQTYVSAQNVGATLVVAQNVGATLCGCPAQREHMYGAFRNDPLA
jgi:hypothetical protein